MLTHKAKHPEFVADCFTCKVLTVGFSQAAMPTRKPHIVFDTLKEKRLSDDLPAYKRLRLNGVQPTAIDGAADIEKRAEDRFEIEMGHVVPKEHKSQVRDGLEMVREMKDNAA